MDSAHVAKQTPQEARLRLFAPFLDCNATVPKAWEVCTCFDSLADTAELDAFFSDIEGLNSERLDVQDIKRRQAYLFYLYECIAHVRSFSGENNFITDVKKHRVLDVMHSSQGFCEWMQYGKDYQVVQPMTIHDKSYLSLKVGADIFAVIRSEDGFWEVVDLNPKNGERNRILQGTVKFANFNKAQSYIANDLFVLNIIERAAVDIEIDKLKKIAEAAGVDSNTIHQIVDHFKSINYNHEDRYANIKDLRASLTCHFQAQDTHSVAKEIMNFITRQPALQLFSSMIWKQPNHSPQDLNSDNAVKKLHK